ncbi:signal peptide peptidase SppA [Avibacterium paragallinarum]|uniref:signal peptide peptidase SppA n=1 Tax=Avibacterium paragallinarum TaxID=728 RepID=UPI003979AB62
MKFLFKLLKFFWSGLNFLRNLVMNAIFLLFLMAVFVIAGLIMNPNKDSKVQLFGEQGALFFKLDGYLADDRGEYSLRDILKEIDAKYDIPRQISTFDIVYAIRKAANDERIQGLVFDLNHFDGADLPAIKYVGSAISEFKASGKPVIAYADSYTQKQYLLASYADEIYLNPIGRVDIKGLSVRNLYYKDLLDKLKVTPHIFRVGTYKSAVEPFLRNDMSLEAKRNLQRWLNLMWADYEMVIAENRQIPRQDVLPSVDKYFEQLRALDGDQAIYAKQRKFVSQIADRFTLNKALIDLFGQNHKEQPKLLPFDDYLSSLPDRMAGGLNNIAVVNIEGTIIDGNSDENGVGGDSIAKLLRRAYDNDKVKAVIVRINSPGGSAFASEIIRQEIVHLQQAGKPVIVSMGAMAASGGYWIASTADYIFADADTITGSIGIFSIFPTFEKSIGEIGINSDGISTSELANQSIFAELSKVNSDIHQLEIEYGYDKFLSLVSKGRHLDKNDVDKIAQGQVWLGKEALEHKLVDELGDFDRAVDKARELVYAKSPQEKQIKLGVEWIVEEDDSILGGFFKGFKKDVQYQLLQGIGVPNSFFEIKKKLNQLSLLNDPKGQYLYCINCGILN